MGLLSSLLTQEVPLGLDMDPKAPAAALALLDAVVPILAPLFLSANRIGLLGPNPIQHLSANAATVQDTLQDILALSAFYNLVMIFIFHSCI